MFFGCAEIEVSTRWCTLPAVGEFWLFCESGVGWLVNFASLLRLYRLFGAYMPGGHGHGIVTLPVNG